VEQFVLTAFRDWGEHHERIWLWDRRAFAGRNAFAGFGSNVSLFAGATRDADTRADWIRVRARTIASFALTVFFVVAAFVHRHRNSFGSWYAAFFRLDAHALFVFQESRFAEASDDAVLGAGGVWVGFGAGRSASGAASEEHFIVFALRHFRWVGEKHVGLGSFRDLQTTYDFVVAFVRRHAFSVGVLQESLFTETALDTLHGAKDWRLWISAIRCTRGSAD
jgi:hypothetical protein